MAAPKALKSYIDTGLFAIIIHPITFYCSPFYLFLCACASTKTITTTYEYDGAQFVLEATVDAVQTHNAKDAIKSAWGVDVNISDDGALSLE